MYSGTAFAFVGYNAPQNGGCEINYVVEDWTTLKAAALTPEPSNFALLGSLLGMVGLARKCFA